jgi:hypothetical protein
MAGRANTKLGTAIAESILYHACPSELLSRLSDPRTLQSLALIAEVFPTTTTYSSNQVLAKCVGIIIVWQFRSPLEM